MELLQIAIDLWGLLLRVGAYIVGAIAMCIFPIAATGAAIENIIKGFSLGAMLIIIALILGAIGKLIKERM